MDILTSIKNVLQFINDNWATIVVILGLMAALNRKVKTFINKTEEEKIAIAKAQIKEVILMLVTNAEEDYCEWVKAGSIKRSQVIDKIFTMYPILSTITNQDDVVAWIDEAIDTALKEMRKILEQQEDVTQDK